MNMKNQFRTIFYRPNISSISVDVLFLVLSVVLTLFLAPLTTQSPFEKYKFIIIQYLTVWMGYSYFLSRYKDLSKQKYFSSGFKTAITSFLTVLTFFFLSKLPYFDNHSIRVILAFTILVFLINLIFITFYFAVRNAIEYSDDEIEDINKEDPYDDEIFKQAKSLESDDYNRLRDSISLIEGKKVFDFISNHINLSLDHNYVSYAANTYDIKNLNSKDVFNLVIFKKLNFVGHLNRLFSLINNKIPPHGYFVCAFEEKNVRNFNFKRKYPKNVAWFLGFIDYFYHRVLPKLFLTKGIYNVMNEYSQRSLTKPEVLGRLHYAGFEVISEKKIEQITYVIARKRRRVKLDLRDVKYGMLIKLRRIGKGGKKIKVYKFRTMYPFSEFIQAYVYTKYSLQKGGKINRDIRVSPIGKFLRKFWLDEFPMLYNILKGDMKIVGVRPLSEHFFSLYEEELQIKRTQYKPGLLPPFYADMPKTLDEVQISEMKYLIQCEEEGEFITDLRYFIKIINNILFKKARSA